MLQASSGDDRCAGGLAADMEGDPTTISIGRIEGADLQHERRLRSLGLPECGEGVVRCRDGRGAEQAGRRQPAGLGGWPSSERELASCGGCGGCRGLRERVGDAGERPLHLAAQGDDCPDDGDGDECHQEAVLDRCSAPLDSTTKCGDPGQHPLNDLCQRAHLPFLSSSLDETPPQFRGCLMHDCDLAAAVLGVDIHSYRSAGSFGIWALGMVSSWPQPGVGPPTNGPGSVRRPEPVG